MATGRTALSGITSPAGHASLRSPASTSKRAAPSTSRAAFAPIAGTTNKAAPANSTPLPRAPPKSPTTTFPSENRFYVFVSINPVLLQNGGGGQPAPTPTSSIHIEVFQLCTAFPMSSMESGREHAALEPFGSRLLGGSNRADGEDVAVQLAFDGCLAAGQRVDFGGFAVENIDLIVDRQGEFGAAPDAGAGADGIRFSGHHVLAVAHVTGDDAGQGGGGGHGGNGAESGQKHQSSKKFLH